MKRRLSSLSDGVAVEGVAGEGVAGEGVAGSEPLQRHSPQQYQKKIRVVLKIHPCCSIYQYFLAVFFLNKFIYLFMAALGLRCCTQAFSSCVAWGLLFIAVRGPHCCGFSCCGAWVLSAQASVVVAHGL